jgi:hypothetical protein
MIKAKLLWIDLRAIRRRQFEQSMKMSETIRVARVLTIAYALL